jgi:hypothetical protein
MNFIPLTKSSLERILKPINRLTESCVLNIGRENVYSICSSPDNTVILYANAKLPVPGDRDELIKLNLISVKKLLSGLECLGSDGEFSIQKDNNSIKCQNIDHNNSEKTFFKYHLVDDSIVKEAPVNINKIASLKFDTEFSISTNKIKQLMSGYAFASDMTKIYFSTQEKCVIAEINDKTLQNVDNISVTINSSFVGEEIIDPIPISMEIFKNLAYCKSDIKVKINSQYKVFVFQNTEEEGVDLKYIISALVK